MIDSFGLGITTLSTLPFEVQVGHEVELGSLELCFVIVGETAELFSSLHINQRTGLRVWDSHILNLAYEHLPPEITAA